MWPLYDSKSPMNVSDHQKHFPGSSLHDTEDSGTFFSATGQPFKSQGKFTVRWRSENGHARSTTYLDAPVSMPIISSHLWNADGFRTTLEAEWGDTLEKATGLRDPVVVRNGTYFMKMRVDKKRLPNKNARAKPKDVHKAGAA